MPRSCCAQTESHPSTADAARARPRYPPNGGLGAGSQAPNIQVLIGLRCEPGMPFVTGAIIMVLVGGFLNGTALPMVTCIAGCAALALISGQVTLRQAARGAAGICNRLEERGDGDWTGP